MRPRAVDSFYEDIADRFEGLDHPADVRRRLAVVFDECLAGTALTGMRTLDAGCGYGLFSAAAAARGALVVSLDVARAHCHTATGRRRARAHRQGRWPAGGHHAESRVAGHRAHGEPATPPAVPSLENFVDWDELERACVGAGLEVLRHVGFHPWPFQLGLQRAARRVEQRLGRGRAGR